MNGWTLTKVWQVDHKLVVAPTIEDAIALFKVYMGKDRDYRGEPYEVTAVRTSDYLCDYAAIIKDEEV